MYMTGLRRDERGSVMVLAAVLIPVFVLLAALVIDVGTWFTHKRQLQNRADAAAFAAGAEYARNWQGCAQNTDATLKQSMAQKIANAAYQYAGDPESADYTNITPSGVLPASLYNDQIAAQTALGAPLANNRLDVVVNSANNDYTNNQDYTDDYDSNPVTKLGDPCYLHPSDPEGLSAAGQWTDVKVTERSVGRMLGPFSPDIHARARIEIRPALSGHRFIPIAVPDNVVTNVQVRYYDQCTGNELLRQDLAQLPGGTFNGYQSRGGGTLWAVPDGTGSTPLVGDPSKPVTLPLLPYDPVDCGSSSYRPISEQVRVTSNPSVDINQPCSTLQSTSFADCFTRLSQIRVWETGSAESDVRVREVTASGGCSGPGDAYFGTLPLGATNCPYDVQVVVDWGTRDDGDLHVAKNFKVSANSVPLSLVSWDTTPGGTAVYASSGGALTAAAGANDITVSLNWEDTDNTHSYGGPCSNKARNPCKYSGTRPVHRVFVGKNSTSTSDPAATGTVESVHTSLQPLTAAGDVGPSFDNWRGGTPIPGCGPNSCQVYPTVGIRSALTGGTLVTLRTGDPQGSQLVQCDPAVPNGKELINFKNGCEPWFWGNSFTNGDWWNTTTQTCPDSGLWYRLPAAQVKPYINSAGNPWECVLNSPGTSAGQTGDWFAVATDNCTTINSAQNQCQTFKKKTDATVRCANYDGIGGDKTGAWTNTGDSADPRVVSLFIVPYQALKNTGGSGSGDEIPILRFANFYVMNWYGQNSSSNDPCPDPDFNGKSVSPPDKATVIGVFVTAVDYEQGPVDPNAICRIDVPETCRPVLTR